MGRPKSCLAHYEATWDVIWTAISLKRPVPIIDMRILGNMLLDQSDLERILQVTDDGDNFLVLVFQKALGGFDYKMKSTGSLKYCGEYRLSAQLMA